jgi:hypothetical protein
VKNSARVLVGAFFLSPQPELLTTIFRLEEVPDLTHEPTVELFRRWKNGDPQYLTLLRLISISSEHPEEAVITRRGLQEAPLSDASETPVIDIVLSQDAMEMDQPA